MSNDQNDIFYEHQEEIRVEKFFNRLEEAKELFEKAFKKAIEAVERAKEELKELKNVE